ncbi:hypothetical protein SEA_RAWRGERTHAT_11 [Mycobacterium phage RawrgerThat]|nr:hypothetical protein SEA_RAWRGERTHAT_11 [Mycobacterium phage RawrgerThat]
MCGCGGGAGSGSRNDTIGYYVVLPDSSVLPAGVNPADPDAGEPPYAFYQEAHNQVVLNGGGTVRRLRKQPATT